MVEMFYSILTPVKSSPIITCYWFIHLTNVPWKPSIQWYVQWKITSTRHGSCSQGISSLFGEARLEHIKKSLEYYYKSVDYCPWCHKMKHQRSQNDYKWLEFKSTEGYYMTFWRWWKLNWILKEEGRKNNSKHLHSSYSMPGTFFRNMLYWVHLILTNTLVNTESLSNLLKVTQLVSVRIKNRQSLF